MCIISNSYVWEIIRVAWIFAVSLKPCLQLFIQWSGNLPDQLLKPFLDRMTMCSRRVLISTFCAVQTSALSQRFNTLVPFYTYTWQVPLSEHWKMNLSQILHNFKIFDSANFCNGADCI